MLYGDKSRKELDKHAEKLFMQLQSKKDRRALYDQVSLKFNMSISTVDDMVGFKRNIGEFTTFEVFCVVYCLDEKSLSKFFTEKEIETLSNSKMEEEHVDFPIVFKNAVKVTEDQWISTITAEQLMKFKQARIINYDENEQRAMKFVKNGDMEIYKPYINRASVEAIKQTMEAGEYIPDPITINMGDEAEFSFDEDKSQLTIYSIPSGMFNLIDGYHRYLAISSIYDFDKSFTLTMELRIVSFSRTKAQRFIYQADQKTQMRRLISNSYNPSDIPNVICSRLNDSPLYPVQGMIGKNGARINAPVLAQLIKTFWHTRQVPKENKNKFIANTTKEIGTKLTTLFEQDDKYYDIKFTDDLLFVICYLFSSNARPSSYAKTIDRIYKKLTEEDKKIMTITKTSSVRRRGIAILDNIIGGKKNV